MLSFTMNPFALICRPELSLQIEIPDVLTFQQQKVIQAGWDKTVSGIIDPRWKRSH